MKRALILAAAVLMAAPALANDSAVSEAMEIAFMTIPACQTGEYGDGGAATGKERLEACSQAIAAMETLSENGYCLKNGEWIACQ